MDAFKAETWYLKGVVLTLQFVCLHHNIHIPTHSPYLTEDTLADMAKTAPHAIEAYVNAYTRNNANLKPTMASHISNTRHDANSSTNPEDLLYDRSTNYSRKTELLETLQQQHRQQQQQLQPQQNDTSALYVGEDTINTPSSYQAMTQAAAAAAAAASGRHSSSMDSASWHRSSISSSNNNSNNQQGVDHHADNDVDMDLDAGSDVYNRVKKERPDEDISMAQWLQQQGITQQQIGQMAAAGNSGSDTRTSTGVSSSAAATAKSNPQQSSTDDNGNDDPTDKDQIHNLSAIQRIRLQLRIQSALSSNNKNSERLQPTILQLAIPHDPRIDLIPTPHMRDRMIIFRDQINYDECFDLLLNGTRYHGGDPTESDNWEVSNQGIKGGTWRA